MIITDKKLQAIYLMLYLSVDMKPQKLKTISTN